MPHNVELFSAALVKMTIEEDNCVEEVLDSIHILGQHHTDTVLMAYHDHLLQHNKLTASQGALLLESMGKIIRNTLDQISQPLAQKIISLSAMWMTKSVGAYAASQEAASNILVTMSFRFTDKVVQLMLENFKNGHHPHVFVVKTLTKLSAENPYSMVPFLKQILAAMFPSLFGTKQEEMKAAFATALGSFSKSILMYLANVEKTSEPTVTAESFSAEINTIYSLLFKVWLEKEPPKLTIIIVEALGSVISLLPRERIEKELPKIIPAIMSLYKKYPGHSSVTECLCQVLGIAMEINKVQLKTQMDSLLKNLHQQICLSVGTKNCMAMKNHSEVLRCFTVLAPVYADAMVDFLLPKLDCVDQQTRLGTLSALRHVISSVSSHLDRKKAPIVAAITPLLVDKLSNQEKKLIAQVICILAQQGHLEPEEGRAMVEFLIRQCATPLDSGTVMPASQRADQVTDEDLVTVCETVMFMITNTVGMEDVLWPFLLEFLTMIHYTKALTTICNCLAHLGKKKLQSSRERFTLTYNVDSCLPKAQELLSRLLLLSYCPYEGGSQGAAALRLLQVLSFSIHPATVAQWDKELPALVDQLLVNTKQTLPLQEWEEKLLLFLSKTLDGIGDEEWAGQLSEVMCEQMETVCHSPQKAFLYKALGIALSQVRNENIQGELQQMLLTVQHSEAVEREGMSFAFGFASMTHYEDVLHCLEEFATDIKLYEDMDGARSTLVLCYGNMALYAPEEQVLFRTETHILPAIREFIGSDLGSGAEWGESSLQLSLIKAMTLIAKSLHLNQQRLPCHTKKELLKYMQDFMEAEPVEVLHSPVRQMVMRACIHLVQVRTESSHTDTLPLIHTCLATTFSLVPTPPDPDADAESDPDILYAQTITALKELLKQVLVQDLTPECLQATFKQVEEWVTSSKEYERERAMDTMSELLQYCLEEVAVGEVMLQTDLGFLAGRLMPRCADPSLLVRQMSVDSLYTLLVIQFSDHEGDVDRQDKQLEILRAVRGELEDRSPAVLFHTCWQIAELISRCLPQDQRANLLFMVLAGLSDHQPDCCRAAAVLTRSIITTLGRELNHRVPEVLEALRMQLQSGRTREEVRLSVLRSIALLASHNPRAVVDCLLTYPDPSDRYISEVWHSLAGDTEGSPLTLRELLDTLKQQLQHWEKRTYPLHENVTPHPSMESLAGICALHEMIRAPESVQVVTELFPQLFSILLVHLSSFVEISLSKVFIPNSQTNQKEFLVKPQTLRSKDICVNCVQALMALMGQVNNEQLVKCMTESGGWGQMMDLCKTHLGVIQLAKAMAVFAGPCLNGVVEQLAALLPTVEECQKMTVAAFFGELLRSSLVSSLQLTDAVGNKLLQCLLNSSPILQTFCVKGLGNITIGDPNNIEKYSRQVLCAMIYLMGSEQHDNEVLMFEVLLCLGQYVNLLKVTTIKPFLIKILTGIQTFFESSNDRVRAEAFNVLGSLAKCGTRDPKSSLCRQIQGNLVRLLLQLDARSEEISRSCNLTLHLVAPLVASTKTCSLIENYVGDPTLSYMVFLRAMSQQLMKEFPERTHSYVTDCVSFFNKPEEQLRANAVTLSGLFFQRPEKRSQSARKST